MSDPIHFSAFELTDAPEYDFGGERAIDGLEQINVFVGANNSGKSRLLRVLAADPKRRFRLPTSKTRELSKFITTLNEEVRSAFGRTGASQVDGILSSGYRNASGEFLAFDFDPLPGLLEFVARLEQSRATSWASEGPGDPSYVAQQLRAIGASASKRLRDIGASTYAGPTSIVRHYVPILRGLRPFLKASDPYLDRTTHDYFPYFSSTGPVIFSGLSLYQSLKNSLLGEPEERTRVRDFEEFLSTTFFDRQPFTLIPKENDPGVVHVKIGEARQFPIHQLGDGLQNLIILLFLPFITLEPALFFFEEPETHLHPSFQRTFLDTLRSFKQHQFFFTTHSNHLLDLAGTDAKIAIYHFEKTAAENFLVRRATQADREMLTSLGVRPSSVLHANATVWVEGITDRKYLRLYMSRFLQDLETTAAEKFARYSRLREDRDYSFVEYQGSTLTHWDFDPTATSSDKAVAAESFCSRAFVIADGDIRAKGARSENLSRSLGDRFYPLPVKEIENLIPEELLRAAIKRRSPNLADKTDHIAQRSYRTDEGLGTYLQETLGEDGFAEPSGTVRRKAQLCDDVLEAADAVKWTLTDDLRELCEKVFEHVDQASNAPVA